jgi:Flp pilus assembly pilin Flp
MTFSRWVAYVRRSVRVESGQTMPEYGIVLGVITILTITAIASLSSGIITLIKTVAAFLVP